MNPRNTTQGEDDQKNPQILATLKKAPVKLNIWFSNTAKAGTADAQTHETIFH